MVTRSVGPAFLGAYAAGAARTYRRKFIRPVTIETIDAKEPPATSSPSQVGNLPWSDDDDLTYVDIRNESTFVSGEEPEETRQDTVRATFEPANIVGLKYAVMRVRGWADSQNNSMLDGIRARYSFRDEALNEGIFVEGSIDYDWYPTPGDWSWTIHPEDWSSSDLVVFPASGFAFEDFEAVLNDGVAVDVWVDSFDWGWELLRVHEFSLELVYGRDLPVEVAGGAVRRRYRPAMRHRQRGDGLNMSTVSRALQHNSVQGSLRNIGFD